MEGMQSESPGLADWKWRKIMTIIPVILSGGSGTRLWPLSRASYPKQLLPLVSDNTMIQETALRLNGLDVQEPIVVCNEQHRFIIAEQLAVIGMKKPSIILEPVAKNTAPAIAAACLHAQKIDSEAVIVVLPSDHNIKDTQAFQEAVKIAASEAQNGSMVTFGITPTFAATGYGYIEKQSDSDSAGVSSIKRFVEKPDVATAQKYLDSGNFFWNSGMFVFKASAFLEELKELDEAIFTATSKSVEKAVVDSDFIRLDKDSFSENPSISIDYAVMEKTSHGKVVPLSAGWSDVGSWSSLWEVSDKDENNNTVKGEAILKNTKGSLIYSKERLVATIGLTDVVIVDTKDALLVATKSQAEQVKDIVDELKKAGNPVAVKYTE